jgi:NADH-quinone oxidoreductase subunit J
MDVHIVNWSNNINPTTNIEAIGELLYTYYFYAFLVASLILLVAMIGAILLTMRKRRGVKKQKISEQISVSDLNSIEKKKVKLGEGINV